MSKRSYVSVARAEAAAEKKERVIQAATRFLREADSITAFSLDSIAKAAGVTRLTVYNQFGSRRGLLEAVFDDIAQRGQLLRLNGVMAEANPSKGLDLLISIFCDFWSGDPAVTRLHDAMVIDQEFAEALLQRNERRRRMIGDLVARIAGEQATVAAKRDAVDLIFALTSCGMFRMLSGARPIEAVCAIITHAAWAAITRISSPSPARS
ncbi:transcriptional regulator [Rhizobium leguminosarum bv. trifolii WSM2297]|uniref:Transcriptional regulator n=1 Tax=Rhizobium leguminosarum bv. trifolii WSM2297 TaxID=754762 RepID=J0WFU3_RHILT|nr:TetR/AcrR family transcriptional regulator [Rhizobium leguminosarum]EJC84278.1 transcriptional regulator [Rhizobium leguminosarum bv. trifolii WSM2297]